MTANLTSPIWSAESGPAEAPLVALVHGSMDRSAGMLRLSRRLDATCRVLRYDRRGYGRSAPHGGPYGIEAQVDDLAALLGGRSAVVLGHSYGGNVALAAAQRLADAVAAVVVYEAPLSWRDEWPGMASRQIAAGGEPADLAERFMRGMIGDQRWERLPSRTRLDRRAEGSAMVGELTALRAAQPWDATRIDVPVVAVAGSEGRPHHVASSRHIAGEIAGARYVEIRGAGHNGHSSHPGEVAAVVLELVDSSPARRARMEP